MGSPASTRHGPGMGGGPALWPLPWGLALGPPAGSRSGNRAVLHQLCLQPRCRHLPGAGAGDAPPTCSHARPALSPASHRPARSAPVPLCRGVRAPGAEAVGELEQGELLVPASRSHKQLLLPAGAAISSPGTRTPSPSLCCASSRNQAEASNLHTRTSAWSCRPSWAAGP